MTNNDIFADEAEVEADLVLQETLLWSRATLARRIVEASQSQAPAVIEMLRIEAMYQFCEFFYLIKARRIEEVDQLEALADIHNRHLDALSRDAEKVRRMGLTRARVLDAIFTADTLPRLLEIWRARPGHLDQSNLARFLATVMSSETCRKLVIASAEAGFLARTRSPYGSMLVSSTGALEQIFGGVLRDLRHRIAAINHGFRTRS